MSNPLDDYLEMTKQAGFGDLLRGAWRGFSGSAKPLAGKAMERGFQLGEKAQGPAAIAAGTALIGGGAAAIKKIKESIDRKNDFKQMMKVDPELKEIQSERPAFFNQAYNSLRRMNPQFGSDPIVAGSYMRKMMSNPDAAGLTLAQSVKPPGAPEDPMSFQTNVGPFKIGF